MFLAVPGIAQAQGGPNSGVDEYVEGVPGPGGEKPSQGQGGGDGGSSPLPPQLAQQLAAAGVDGESLASIVAGTAPDSAKLRKATRAAGAGSAGGEAGSGSSIDAGPAEFAIADLAGAAGTGDEEGMGLLMPILLIGTLVLAVLFTVARSRS